MFTSHPTYTRYDARGQAIWQVSPEAINLPANLADIEQYPDLLNEVAGIFQYAGRKGPTAPQPEPGHRTIPPAKAWAKLMARVRQEFPLEYPGVRR